jgi:hypothetical protein
MGAGILPTALYKGKLYFLFGKENKYEDSAPGFSDFGGGTDNSESYMQTAIREAGEELTGFLGSDNDIKKMLQKYGTYNIDYKSGTHSTYRMHIFPMEYDHLLPFYYNNNQRFLQKRLDPKIIKNSKIFEKEEIRWVCVDELKKMRGEFRSYFQNIVDIIIEEKSQIKHFINHSIPFSKKQRIRRIQTKKYNNNSKNKTTKNYKYYIKN